jgi:bifunctional non-homologous end joining protein LigD
MLATLTDKSFDRDGWIFEIKWDGYRALAQIASGSIKIYSRNLRDFTDKFDSIKKSLGKIPYDIVLDGEIIITDSQGRSDFSGLKKYLKTGNGNPVYYVFDLLYINGYSLVEVPLLQRKILLEKVLPGLPDIKISSHIDKTGKGFFVQARENGLEGIMAKKADSPYEPSARSKNWLKIKVKHTQDIVIGGYIKRPGNKSFKSIVAGIYKNKKLTHIGNIGSGFNQDRARMLFDRLKKITTAKSPFSMKIRDSQDIIWVEPEIVAEVQFSQWTPDGFLRHPVLKTIRDDKQPLQVVKESVLDNAMDGPGAAPKTGYRGKLSHPDKIFWPDEGYSKKDLFEYYREVSEFILPHISGRPQSLHRHPDGINGESFFQKDISFKPPSWIETFLVSDKEKPKDIHYLVCKDIDSLLYMANLGCIEINPWLSRVEEIERPDFIVIDLDPTDTGFSKVISTAIKVREVLGMLGIKSFIKTSGATGLHIYIPTGSKYDYSQSLQFANMLAIVTKRRIPGISSIERSPRKRQGKVYLDYLQNRMGQTIAAPYCVRPRPFAPVSTPLFWDELEDLKDPAVFNIKSIFKRLEKYGDIWKDIYNKNLDMEKVLSNIQELYEEYNK